MHGGYRSLRLAAPTGCVAAHGLDADVMPVPLATEEPIAAPPSAAWGGAMAQAMRRAGR